MRKLRTALLWMALTLAIGVAALWTLTHVIAPQLTVRAAVGGDQGDAQKFMLALGPMVARDGWRKRRFETTAFPDPAEAAHAMEADRIDLMIARADIAPRRRAQTLVVMRTDAVMVLLPPKSTIEGFADLAGKTVAMPDGVMHAHNEKLLLTLLAYYAIDPAKVMRVTMPAADIGKAMAQKKVAAAFVVGPSGLGVGPAVFNSIRKAMRAAPSLLDIGEASAIAKIAPPFEAVEIPRGAVNGNPPVPDDTVNTVALPVKLLANARMHNSTASDIARLATTRKATLADSAPGAELIQAPDTEDSNASPPVHPGALAYFNGDEESWWDRFENAFYYGGILISLIGSFIAWLIGRVRGARSERDPASLQAALDLVAQARNAEPEQRPRIAQAIEETADEALRQYVGGDIDADRYARFTTALERARRALADKAAAPAAGIASARPGQGV